jgi:hypothetical protein
VVLEKDVERYHILYSFLPFEKDMSFHWSKKNLNPYSAMLLTSLVEIGFWIQSEVKIYNILKQMDIHNRQQVIKQDSFCLKKVFQLPPSP